jgi:hypothetical protein
MHYRLELEAESARYDQSRVRQSVEGITETFQHVQIKVVEL